VQLFARLHNWTHTDTSIYINDPPTNSSVLHASIIVNRVSACLAGVRQGEFTCVGRQVTLCDPIWQVMPHSSEMTCQEELYRLTINF